MNMRPATEHQEQAALVEWACAHCGGGANPKLSPGHARRQTYCSKACMAEAYRTRMAGSANPNSKSLAKRTCGQCGEPFSSYNSKRKYCSAVCAKKSLRVARTCSSCGAGFYGSRKTCSDECAAARMVAARKSVAKNRPPRTRQVCIQCNSSYEAANCLGRKFCSYQCFVDSGGPQRAGGHARLAMKKYGAKKDANHRIIMEAIGKIAPVKDLSTSGFGVPDGIAWVNDGWHLFDIKNPKTSYGRKGLNATQKKWALNWCGGPVYLIYTVEEALDFARGEFSEICRFPDYKVVSGRGGKSPPRSEIDDLFAWFRDEFPDQLIMPVQHGEDGVAPLIAFVPEHSLFIGLSSGRVSPEQAAVHADLRAAGYVVLIAHGWDEAREAILLMQGLAA